MRPWLLGRRYSLLSFAMMRWTLLTERYYLPRQGLSAVAGEVIGVAPPIALGQLPAGSRGIL